MTKGDAAETGQRHVFSVVSTGIECLFFIKTMRPVRPGDFVRNVCQDARDCPDPRQRKCKYINRLTPVFDTDKATEKGILRVARSVLAPFFTLAEGADEAASKAAAAGGDEPGPAYTVCPPPPHFAGDTHCSRLDADTSPSSMPSGTTSAITPPSSRTR